MSTSNLNFRFCCFGYRGLERNALMILSKKLYRYHILKHVMFIGPNSFCAKQRIRG